MQQLRSGLRVPDRSRLNRHREASALVAAAVIQIPGASLRLPVMVVCGFLLGLAGQVVKLCADSAMQMDVDDALRGHVFAVQDALFWVAFIVAITVAALLIPDDGRAPAQIQVGSCDRLCGSPPLCSSASPRWRTPPRIVTEGRSRTSS